MSRTYYRVGRKYKPSEILPLLERPQYGNWGPKRILLDGDWVNIKSSRLATFEQQTVCARCGIKGTFFVKERQQKIGKHDNPVFHLNFYAMRNGKEILMTSDHIVPLSALKQNPKRKVNNNRQTMCARCNMLKGNREISNEELSRAFPRLDPQ